MRTYPGSAWPGILAFKADPGVDVRNGQELGDLGVGNHFWLLDFHDMHGSRISDHASDLSLLEACLLSNLSKGDLATSRYHIWDVVSADCVNAGEIGDLCVLGPE